MKIRGLFAVLALLALALGFNSNQAQAQASQGPLFIRIGLESHFLEQEQIPIHTNSLTVGHFSAGNFHASGVLNSQANFQAQPSNSFFVRLPYTFQSLQQAQNAAHPDAIPAMLGVNQWGLYLVAQGQEHAQQLAGTITGSAVVNPSTSRVSISTGGALVLVSDNASANLQVHDATGITSLGVRGYRGFIELARFTGNRLTAVNIVDLEEYLFSVVPAEMPASWHIEALKAQAVAARTFTHHRMASPRTAHYVLCDTEFSQVYAGVQSEHPNTTRAVNYTRGLLILHNGQPILAAYSSSSGGFTANSEDVWVAALPYLRTVAEVYEPGAMQWQRTLTLSQLNQVLSRANVNIGQATGVQIITNPQGRVMQFTIQGTAGSHTLERENIRTFFSSLPGGSLRSRNFTIVGGAKTPLPGQNLASVQGTVQPALAFIRGASETAQNNLTGLHITSGQGTSPLANIPSIVFLSATGPVNAPAATAGTAALPNLAASIISSGYYINLDGRGWGHGVGMSQHGARGMAEMGFNFRQILQHYYTGVEIR